MSELFNAFNIPIQKIAILNVCDTLIQKSISLF